jgi:ribose-phosphate pyrophosphokinase
MTTKLKMFDDGFYTPAEYERGISMQESPRGSLLVASCRSGKYLAERVVDVYREHLKRANLASDVAYLADIDGQFSDSETYVRLEKDVSGNDVFLFQSLYDPSSGRSVDENYASFLIACRAFREWGANLVTGVLPYLAYARQDKPTVFTREATSANLMADLSVEAGVDRVVTWHPHSQQIQGFYDHIPVDRLEAVGLFRDVLDCFRDRQDALVVAPDAGAAKFVTRVGRLLNLRSAIASKFRPRPEEAVISEVIGDFSGVSVALVLDDMISSGGTIYELVKKMVKEKGIREVYLAVSHNLCREVARERLLELHAQFGLKEVVVTDSIPQSQAFLEMDFLRVVGLAGILSQVINRIHYNRPVTDLFYDAR